MPRRRFARALLALLALPLAGAPAAAQLAPLEHEGASALGLALRRLGTTKRVLMVGAHPDDESTQILSTLALGQGAEVAYLSLTRGEGGQNGIGPELGEGLGLLRTEELLAARRLDGARQFFTRAYDYGFSKNAEEAFRHWPRDSVLSDVVAVVRDFRPDVIVAVFSGTPRDGHGQHQASGILAREAFDAAADPARFPEQLRRGLRPHAPTRLYQALWRDEAGAGERLETGRLDPLLGASHFQVAMASRSRHRSQDMGQLLSPGPRHNVFRLMASHNGAGEGASGIFAGVDTTLALRAGGNVRARGLPDARAELLSGYTLKVAEARRRYHPEHPEEILPLLLEARGLLERAAPGAGYPLSAEIAAERAELDEAVVLAAGVRLDAVAEKETVVPGESFEVTLTVWNGGAQPLTAADGTLVLAPGWRVEPLGAWPDRVAPGTLATRRYRVTVGPDAEPTVPYYLLQPRRGDLYAWPETMSRSPGRPFEKPVLPLEVALTVGGATLSREVAPTFRGVDKRQGEFRRPLRVVPAVTVAAGPGISILPLGAPKPLDLAVRLRAEVPAGIAGTVRLEAPAGWRVEPASVPLRLAGGEERAVEFRVTPAPGVAAGEYSLGAVFQAEDGRRFSRGYHLVDYPHVDPRPLYGEARVGVRALDVRVAPGLRVGYVAGAGDDAPEALRQLGVTVEPLGPEALAGGDLSGYDAIVTGIRAYEVNQDLIAHNRRLLDYARAGGTVIVQYNKYEYAQPGIAPFPVKMAQPHDRVTDEEAPVRLLRPDHPALAGPNRITAADFQGWVQERGLYYLNSWDERYTPLLEMADPGEAPLRGGLLVAPLGQGTYVYTGLAFFRQLPAGVPGAYRLFANLISLGADK